MKLSNEEVKKLANLAKLSLTPEEIEKYGHQLTDVLKYVERLESLDLENIKESLTGIASHDVATPRHDEVGDSDHSLIEHASLHDEDFIISPPVFKK